MKFLIINGKIQTLNGKPIIVPDTYDNNLIKIGDRIVKTGSGLIGSKHSESSGGGSTVIAGATFNDDANGNADGIEGDVFLTWEELKLDENGKLYVYENSYVNDEVMGGAFYGCTSIKSIWLPDSINYITEYAFSTCLNLTSINTGSVSDIGVRAFEYCKNLTSVTLPNSLVSPFNPSCFEDCERLTDINFTGTQAEWNAVIINANWWNEMNTKVHTIHCTDGDIVKS